MKRSSLRRVEWLDYECRAMPVTTGLGYGQECISWIWKDHRFIWEQRDLGCSYTEWCDLDNLLHLAETSSSVQGGQGLLCSLRGFLWRSEEVTNGKILGFWQMHAESKAVVASGCIRILGADTFSLVGSCPKPSVWGTAVRSAGNAPRDLNQDTSHLWASPSSTQKWGRLRGDPFLSQCFTMLTLFLG